MTIFSWTCCLIPLDLCVSVLSARSRTHTCTHTHILALTKSSVVLVGSWAKIMLSWIHSCSLGKRTDPGTFHHLLCQTYLQKAGFSTYQLVLGVEMAPNPVWVCAFMTWFWLILSWFFQMLSTCCNCSILRRNPFDCWVGLKPSIPAVMTVLVPCGATGLASMPRKSGYALLSEIGTWRVVVRIGRIGGGWSGHFSFWKHIAWIWQPGQRLVEILRYMRRSCSSLATFELVSLSKNGVFTTPDSHLPPLVLSTSSNSFLLLSIFITSASGWFGPNEISIKCI